MKRTRTLLLLGALLVLVVGSPAGAGAGLETTGHPGGATTRARSEGSTGREAAPRLAAVSPLHRPATVTTRVKRAPGPDGTRLGALVPGDPFVEPSGRVARSDPEADARLLRSSNTPCCVRGPPRAA